MYDSREHDLSLHGEDMILPWKIEGYTGTVPVKTTTSEVVTDMKKLLNQITIIVIILTTMLLSTSCGNFNQQLSLDEEQMDEQLPIEDESTSHEQPTTGKQLTKEDFLHDFDYLMQTMEVTFPYFGVAERRLGVDIRALGRETRSMIENYPYSLEDRGNEVGIFLEEMPDLDEHIFWSILYHEFFSDFIGFGHAIPYNYQRYILFKPSYTSVRSSYYTDNNNDVFTNPVSLKFYQKQEAHFGG